MIRPCLRLAIFVCAPLVLAPLARAQQDERAAQAKQFYETGMAHFQLEEWDAAIAAWQDGFRAKPVPQFLYNIAQAYRQSKRYEQALNFYKKYLRMDPGASNRAEVERHIASLTELLEKENRATTRPPVSPMAVKTRPEGETPTPTKEPAPAPAPSPTAAPSPAPTPVQADLVRPAPAKKPVTKQPWFWGVVGGGAALVVAVVIVGVVIGASGDSTKILPPARF
jgi:hypothetical protein